MILWDIESGERLRTFEGHDRGLACIEFKVICHLSPWRSPPLIIFFCRTTSLFRDPMIAKSRSGAHRRVIVFGR